MTRPTGDVGLVVTERIDAEPARPSHSRLFSFHAGDCRGPRVFVPHLVFDAIERVARRAGSGHQAGRESIGTDGSLIARTIVIILRATCFGLFSWRAAPAATTMA